MAKIRNLNSDIPNEILEKYPNEAVVVQSEPRSGNDDNYFLHLEKEEVAKKYIQMNVLLSFLTEVLELDDKATIEHMAFRIRDLSIRSKSI